MFFSQRHELGTCHELEPCRIVAHQHATHRVTVHLLCQLCVFFILLLLQTDASQWGMGEVIFLVDIVTGKPLPLGYFSRCFTPQEQKYSVPDQEMMAIKETIEKFEHMLLGHRFIVQTDALNLRSMFSSEVSRIVRSRLAITRHMFEIQHICGEKENEVCDGISRLHGQPLESISGVRGTIGTIYIIVA